MLIEFEVKIELLIIRFIHFRGRRFKQLVNIILDQQRVSKDTHNFNNRTTNLMVVLNDANEAICDNSNMYLDAYSILTLAPKRLDLEMLFNPLEEQFNLPSILVQKSDLTCLEEEVVCIISKRSLQIWSIVNDASNMNWVVAFIPSSSKPNSWVAKDIVFSIKQLFTLHNLIIWMKLLSNDEESTSLFNGEKSCEIKVATIKNVTSKSFIFNPIHGVNIMYACISNSIEYRNLCCNVNLCVYPDTRFCASERSPFKDRQAEVNCCGINSIKTSMQFELLSDSPFLSLSDHVESELLIDSVIAKGIRLRDDAPVGGNRFKAEIVRTFSMSLNDVNKFSKTRTARKLSEDKHIKMIPMSKTPVISSIIMPTDNTIELTFKPISDLIEYELPRMHNCSNLNLDAKVSISNVGQVFLELFHCA